MTISIRRETLEELLNTCFSVIENAAVEGARCPENGTFGVNSFLTGKLTRLGRIRVRVFAHNYRQIEILSGPHKGKRTAAEPKGHEPYRIIDASGTIWPKRFARKSA